MKHDDNVDRSIGTHAAGQDLALCIPFWIFFVCTLLEFTYAPPETHPGGAHGACGASRPPR